MKQAVRYLCLVALTILGLSSSAYASQATPEKEATAECTCNAPAAQNMNTTTAARDDQFYDDGGDTRCKGYCFDCCLRIIMPPPSRTSPS